MKYPARDFPVIGIGCSAGGLEALEAFFSSIPADSGMAFVVIQHLDPQHESALPELLRRVSVMEVYEATEQIQVEPDCVYVIPPNHDMAIQHRRLCLSESRKAQGLRLPIDFFLHSLAEDLQGRAVAIILSGMGADGVQGLQSIKIRAGLVLAQDPATAKADHMPRMAIESGLVDIIAAPEQMLLKIVEHFQHSAQSLVRLRNAIPEAQKSSLEKIVALLYERTGNDFSLYKTSTLYRRIERRVSAHLFPDLDSYLVYLRNNPQEQDLLFKELLIGVTRFFRDPLVWEVLRQQILPDVLTRHPAGQAFRAWIPACSTGEEAYSLAIIFREVWEELKPSARFTLQIYATDLDPEAIEKARKGIYPKSIESDVSTQRLQQYFVRDDEGYRVSREIRDMVIFAQQNIISDPPFTKLHLLFCRNLLIYFKADLQKKLLPLFHYVLNPLGFLVLGSAETIGPFAHLFAPVDAKGRIFQRINQTLPITELALPSRMTHEAAVVTEQNPSVPVDSLEQLTDQLILQTYSPAAVLVNGDGNILYISGRTGKYLEPAAGKVNINLYAMARPGLREALTGVIYQALQQPDPVVRRNISVETEGGIQLVNVTLQGIHPPHPLSGKVLIVFHDLPAPSRRKSLKNTATLNHDAMLEELLQARESLRLSHEEMQVSLEELKSSNEELQATNEELQSTNEELTTSKEEMQSMNEELQTINAELQSKVDDLTWERNDMTNLLNSTEIATIFLDNSMRLRRFTSLATRLFKLIPSDIGRPLSDIVTDIDYPQLMEDAHDVLRTLVFREMPVRTHDGRWYRVRIMPYRTQENIIDGVVSTFIDITEIKQLEAALREQHEGNAGAESSRGGVMQRER